MSFDCEDIMDKITYYRKHEKEREAIAEHGLETVKKYHTYEIRLREMLEILRGYFHSREKTCEKPAQVFHTSFVYQEYGSYILLSIIIPEYADCVYGAENVLPGFLYSTTRASRYLIGFTETRSACLASIFLNLFRDAIA